MAKRGTAQSQFHRYFAYGVEIIRLGLGARAKGDVYQKIAEEVGYFSAEVVRNWTRNTMPSGSAAAEGLSQFAMRCLHYSDQLRKQYDGIEPIGPDWVRSLFTHAGF